MDAGFSKRLHSRPVLLDRVNSNRCVYMQKILNWLGVRFQSLGFLGLQRFRILQFAYKIFPCLGCRGDELNFVLNYLPAKPKQQSDILVLDIGSTTSLLPYELFARGYKTFALDQRQYQENMPEGIVFIRGDIIKLPFKDGMLDTVTCISVIEHIGFAEYGDDYFSGGDNLAIAEIARVLKPQGQLLLTTPNIVFSRHIFANGYSYASVRKLVSDYFYIKEYTERRQQVCVALEKRSDNC
jgi:SAM-dependent methyltransferase